MSCADVKNKAKVASHILRVELQSFLDKVLYYNLIGRNITCFQNEA